MQEHPGDSPQDRSRGPAKATTSSAPVDAVSKLTVVFATNIPDLQSVGEAAWPTRGISAQFPHLQMFRRERRHEAGLVELSVAGSRFDLRSSRSHPHPVMARDLDLDRLYPSSRLRRPGLESSRIEGPGTDGLPDDAHLGTRTDPAPPLVERRSDQK